MKKIFKYRLSLTPLQTVSMPKGRVLSVAVQDDVDIYMWAIVEPNELLIDVPIAIFGTGQPIYGEFDNMVLIETIQIMGRFVWHVFTTRECRGDY